MRDSPAPAAGLPTPAPALQARFEAIWRGPMVGLPMLNPALTVQALGFRPWGHHWLGVLVTPWFMNLILMPRLAEHWLAIGEREKRPYAFPAGVFEFIGGRDEVLGDYQACSLFSPMFEFADPAAAAATARAAIDALFEPAHRDAPAAPAEAAPTLSKRGFLFGGARPQDPAGR